MPWATTQDVTALTGAQVTDESVDHAQTVIEIASGLVESQVVATDARFPWMRRAVAYQTAFMVANPDVVAALEVASEHLEGHVYRPREDDPFAATLSPLAKVALRRAGIDPWAPVDPAGVTPAVPAWSFPDPSPDVSDLTHEPASKRLRYSTLVLPDGTEVSL